MSLNLFESGLSKNNFVLCSLEVMKENIKMMTQKTIDNQHIDENCEFTIVLSTSYCSRRRLVDTASFG